MKKVATEKPLHAGSIIADGFGRIDYRDAYSIPLRTDKTIDAILNDCMVMPGWIDTLFRVRNRIVGLFGLKTEERRGHPPKPYYAPGEPSVLFTVLDRNENEIVMGESDKHLDFRASLLVDRLQNRLYLITLVQFHNALGRLYFVPVKPFHNIMLKTLLGNYLSRTEALSNGTR